MLALEKTALLSLPHPLTQAPGHLIALAGPARSGKTTVANYLTSAYGYQQASYATRIKQMAMLAYDLSLAQVTETSLKERIDPRWGISPRVIMQQIGDLRLLTPLLWIQPTFMTQIIPWRLAGHSVIITDVRLGPEADYAKQHGALLIELVRPDHADHSRAAGMLASCQAHQTEQSPFITTPPDLVLHNTGGLSDLYPQLDALVQTSSKLSRILPCPHP